MQKSKLPPKTIDAYIAGFPVEVQKLLNRIRKTVPQGRAQSGEANQIRDADFCPEREPDPFAAYKKHIGVYPVPRMWRSSGRIGGVCGERGDGAVCFGWEDTVGVDWRIVRWRVMRGGAP